MISKDSLELLQKMRDIEYEKYVINIPGRFGNLIKQRDVMECYASITSFISTNSNSIFTVTNDSNSMTVVIRNVVEDNDHIKNYLITVSETSETYKVEQILQQVTEITKILVRDYQKSKI